MDLIEKINIEENSIVLCGITFSIKNIILENGSRQDVWRIKGKIGEPTSLITPPEKEEFLKNFIGLVFCGAIKKNGEQFSLSIF